MGTDEKKIKKIFAEILVKTKNEDYIQCKSNILIFHEKMN